MLKHYYNISQSAKGYSSARLIFLQGPAMNFILMVILSNLTMLPFVRPSLSFRKPAYPFPQFAQILHMTTEQPQHESVTAEEAIILTKKETPLDPFHLYDRGIFLTLTYFISYCSNYIFFVIAAIY